jgi:hypothetical protein
VPRPHGGLGRGGLERGGVCLLSEGGPLPLGKAEIAPAAGGLGGEASGEAEVALRLVRPRKSRSLVLGHGPSTCLGFLHLERIWASKHR